MSSNDKWFFGFITLWVILCAGEPDLLDSIGKSIAGNDSLENQININNKLRVSLERHRAAENYLIKVLHYNKLIDDKQFFEMTQKSMEE